MYHLRRANGTITYDLVEIKKMAVDFYGTVYGKESCDSKSTEELLQDLPKLADEQKKLLDNEITFKELMVAMQQLS